MRVIAVAGGICCGKSSFAQFLLDRLPSSTILSLDWFQVERPDSVPLPKYDYYSPQAYDFKSFHKAFEDLRERVPVQIHKFDHATGKRKSAMKRVNPADVIIIEGLYVLMHASLRSQFSYTFYLESPLDVILARLIERNREERGWELDFTMEHYFTYDRPAYLTHALPTRQFASMAVSNDYHSRLDLFLDDFLTKYRL